MLTYDLKVGYSCNNHCKHCVIDDSKDKLLNNKVSIDLTTNECIEQIDEMLKKGITSIVLTGGEVTIRKDFSELIKKSVESNLSITVQTNGRRLNDIKIINAIKDVKNIKFVIALHGKSAETHDAITQVSGSFIETCQGIKKMCLLGKNIILKIVISKINMLELPEIIKLASNLGVKYICFAFPHGHGAARKNFSEIIPTYSELKEILREMIDIATQEKINIEFEAIPFCVIPYAMQLVGELKYFEGNTICTQVREDTFDWEKVRKSIKRKGNNCINCDMDNFCEGPWSEYVEIFGTDELIPIRLPTKSKELIYKSLNKKKI